MEIVLLTALGVGGATVFGAVIGFCFQNISHKFKEITLAFAAGIMLAAAMVGLILPSIEYGGECGIAHSIIGILVGAFFLLILDRLIPRLAGLSHAQRETQSDRPQNRILLFVLAIAIHNLPEGIAAGVGFGSGNSADAILIAGAIALQNIPEGMVIIAPMLASGISPKKTFFYAALTGLVEVIGTFIGYFAVRIATAVLPFSLAFAGGTMLYVITDEMIPEMHAEGNTRAASVALLIGFCLMLLLDAWLS